MLDEAEALALSTNSGGRSTDGRDSAPSWQDYIDALRQEGRRYRPASLSKALEKRERVAGKPRTSEEERK